MVIAIKRGRQRKRKLLRRKHKYYIIRIGVTHMREKELSEEHSPSVVKQALAIASKMGGNMTGATAAIEKKRKGLSKHKQVAAKITKSADMIGSVYHHLEYEESPMGEVTEEVDAPKMDVTDADKKANSPAYQKMKKGNPRYNDKTTKKVKEGKDKTCSDKCCGSEVKAEDCKCPPTCEHCNCNAVAESYKESLAAKLENVQQQRKAVAEDLAPTKDQLKGKELDALRNKNVAKMRDEDEAAKKAQRDRFAAIKKSADNKGK